MASQLPRLVRRLILVVLACAVACKQDSKPEERTPAGAPAIERATDASAPPGADTRSKIERLLDWVDPDAVSAGFVRLDEDVDVAALSVVFALPPRAERMLYDAARIVDDLDAVLPPDAERPPPWLGPEAVVMSPVVSPGNYVVRSITKPRADVEKALDEAGLAASDADDIKVFTPDGAFPWKVAVLSDDAIAFIPVREIGSGLNPLTAARDLPPSDLERELRKAIEADSGAVLEIYARGPIVHLELAPELAGVRLSAKPWHHGGLDVAVIMQPTRDATAVRERLEDRDLPLETNVIKFLADRVAYTLDGNFVTGRLQLTPADMRSIKESR